MTRCMYDLAQAIVNFTTCSCCPQVTALQALRQDGTVGALPTQVQFSINNPAATAMSVPIAQGLSAAAGTAVPAATGLTAFPVSPAIVQPSATRTPSVIPMGEPVQIPLPSNTPVPGVTIPAIPGGTPPPGPVQVSPGGCNCTDMPSSTVTNDCELQVRCLPSSPTNPINHALLTVSMSASRKDGVSVQLHECWPAMPTIPKVCHWFGLASCKVFYLFRLKCLLASIN